jgi:hypothetical protein
MARNPFCIATGNTRASSSPADNVDTILGVIDTPGLTATSYSRQFRTAHITREDLLSFMANQRYGVVSSLSADGFPQSALVGIAVTARFEIIFDTLRSTRKYRNLTSTSACSVVLGFPGERTLQYEGLAFEPKGEERARFQEAYFKTWPDGRNRASWNGMTYMVLRPAWIRFSDFDRQPPLIREFSAQELRPPTNQDQ